MGTMFRRHVGRAALVTLIMLFIGMGTALPAGARSASQAQDDQAQDAPVINTAELKLWPEYDDPGLLVIFSGQFAEGTTFPVKVTFPVPTGARNIQATYLDTSGSLINRPFDVKDGDLTYELPSSAFHVEYYVDRAPSGEQRVIPYHFEVPYAIKTLNISVQQPARSSGFTLTPASENTQQGTDGLTYHVLNRSDLAAGEELALEIKYSKGDTGLSAPQLAVAPTSAAPPQAAAASAAATTGSTNWLPWLLIGLGLVLLAGVLVYWFLTQRGAAPATAAAAGTTRSGPAPAKPAAAAIVRPPARTQATGDAVAFCTNCGHALRPEDRFCSQCGAPRRS